MSTFELCSGGTYTPDPGYESCLVCLAGTFSAVGAAGCECCPAGTYNAADSSSSCDSVPAGYYTTSSSCANTIIGCAYGTYSTGGAVGQGCVVVPAGYHTNGVENFATQIYPCDAGYYSTGGAVSCSPVPAGLRCI